MADKLTWTTNKMITVPFCGSKAKMGDIDVTILAVIIRGTLIQLEVSWMVNGDRKTSWVEEWELSDNIQTVEVGFREI